MAIDRPDWQTGTDIEAQTLEHLDIDIIAQTLAKLNVDIIAQTIGNLAIDITAQSLGNLAINILQQGIGVYLQPEWTAKEGTDKEFDVIDVFQGWLGEASGQYTVPAGKTLFITDASFFTRASYSEDADHPLYFIGYLWDDTTGNYLARVSGLGGTNKIFTKPGIIPENHVFKYLIYNTTPIRTSLAVHVSGFEI